MFFGISIASIVIITIPIFLNQIINLHINKTEYEPMYIELWSDIYYDSD